MPVCRTFWPYDVLPFVVLPFVAFWPFFVWPLVRRATRGGQPPCLIKGGHAPPLRSLVQILCGSFITWPPGKVYGWPNFQKFAFKKIRFLLNLKNQRNFFIKSAYFFLSYNVHKEKRFRTKKEERREAPWKPCKFYFIVMIIVQLKITFHAKIEMTHSKRYLYFIIYQGLTVFNSDNFYLFFCSRNPKLFLLRNHNWK